MVLIVIAFELNIYRLVIRSTHLWGVQGILSSMYIPVTPCQVV